MSAARSAIRGESRVSIVGLDIGGANLKAADCNGNAVTRPFAVWKYPERLAVEIKRIVAAFPRSEVIALTMTAELADCYATKQQGVRAILDAVKQAASKTPVLVWQTIGSFVNADAACDAWQLVAAANWHALAAFAARFTSDRLSLLIDIGTTTTDIIPIDKGAPIPRGYTDRGRLESGELVYTGVRRTPLCAVVPAVVVAGRDCPLAAELFATTLDVYLTLGDIREDAADCETANGRPATIRDARDRLARCLCCDRTEFSQCDAEEMARFVAGTQRRQIARAVDAVLSAQGIRPERLLFCGCGRFLARALVAEQPNLLDIETLNLDTHFGAGGSDAACAYAVARLAAERHLRV